MYGELLARVRALLRRSAPGTRPQRAMIAVDDLALDMDNCRAFLGDTALSLAQKELALPQSCVPFSPSKVLIDSSIKLVYTPN